MVPPLTDLHHSLADINSGRGDLSRRVPRPASPELATSVDEFNEFVGRLEEMVKELAAHTAQLVAEAGQMSAVTDATNKGVWEQQTETTRVAAAINQMVANAQEVSRNTAQATHATGQAHDEARNGTKVV